MESSMDSPFISVNVCIIINQDTYPSFQTHTVIHSDYGNIMA
ncbi:hypothetical protein ACFPFV_05790 [Salinicoccus siamensis]